ncbi:alcohol dehydrogenase catalytic domain-containing protein [Streptomyces sp. NPDC050548]|uniref:alcohol dehydrogenase catalytic domain-containing protein n=1 Tax=Streptomyces sp. NPDC050548 TaxID=3365629 RepID=UPI003799DF04
MRAVRGAPPGVDVVETEVPGGAGELVRVAGEGVARCGSTCAWCAKGRYNLCRLAGTEIFGMTVPGGMAEYFRAPATVLPIAPEVALAARHPYQVEAGERRGAIVTVGVLPPDLSRPGTFKVVVHP